MTFLVPLMMFGWIPLTAALFHKLPPHRAIIVSVIGGVLFLPAAVYEFPPFPDYTKGVAVAVSVLIGGLFTPPELRKRLHLTAYDLPMLVWCFVSPVVSALSNGLSLRFALASALDVYLTWGVVYWAGRKYFGDPDSLRDLAKAFVIGGLLYAPLIAFEARMSPQLSNMIYGFFPHSFLQHIRYGGWRPIVFMEHGLVVSLWMACSFTVAFWFWRIGSVSRIAGMRMGLVVAILLVMTALTRSANAWILALVAIAAISHHRATGSFLVFRLLLFAVPAYVVLRLGGVVSREVLVGIVERVFGDERAASFGIRLLQEELFGARALERPLFGWGHMGRAWPVDAYTGTRSVAMVDSLLTILVSTRGLLGVGAAYTAMLLGPFSVLQARNSCQQPQVADTGTRVSEARGPILSLIVVFAMVDTLMNGFVNPAFLVVAGGLAGLCPRSTSHQALTATLSGT